MTSSAVSPFPHCGYLSLCARAGSTYKLKRFEGARSQCFSTSLIMFTGLWLRMCFHFGSEQPTVTITTPGAADVQYNLTPQNEHQHSYVTLTSFFVSRLIIS
jgi:hypothetical protein